MEIKDRVALHILPDFPAPWYVRSNIATALLSATFAVYWGIYEYALAQSSDNSGLDFTLALMAGVHALYGLTLFFVLANFHHRLAGFISFMMFFMVGFYSYWITKDITNTYFAVLCIAGLISGMYGWLLATLFNSTVIALLVLINTGEISANDNFSTLQIVIYSAVTVMTLVMWTALKVNNNGGGLKIGLRKDKKHPKVASVDLSTEILIDSITDGVAVVSASGVIEVFNPSAQHITGWDENEAVGLDHRSVLVLSDASNKVYENEANPVAKALSLGEPTSDSSARLVTKSKKTVEVDVLASPIKEKGKVNACVVIFRDVSKQRSEERQRAEFISTASHEMRTPVAAIEGYLALAMNEKVCKIDSAARGYLDKAHTSTQHLGKLFQDLLTAAKSEDGRLTNNPAVVEIGHLIDELIEGMKFTAEKKGLNMEADFGQGAISARAEEGRNVVRPVVYIYADPERIREVITNLFDNAIKYTEEGKITIGLHVEDQQVTVSVSDTGAGIPKEDIPHLFQKFYRVDNSATRQIGGTGLGLFISRKIIELYNGHLWVESELGEGSTFHITLPRLSNSRAQELQRVEMQRKTGITPITQSTASTLPGSQAPTATVTQAPDGTTVTTIDARKQNDVNQSVSQ